MFPTEELIHTDYVCKQNSSFVTSTEEGRGFYLNIYAKFRSSFAKMLESYQINVPNVFRKCVFDVVVN